MVNMLNGLRRLGSVPALPLVGAADARWSVISSAADIRFRPTDQLVEIMLNAADSARNISLEDVAMRSGPDPARWIRTWPGEHYRFLAGLVASLGAKRIVEIGTFQGHGSMSLLAGSDEAQVVTYDIIPWNEIPASDLRPSDFSDGRLEQRIGDLANLQYLKSQIATLQEADLIFVDGPKDGEWERKFCDRVLPQLSSPPKLVVFDDIRLLAMVQLWRDLPYAKLDATSTGHWSGTGLLQTA
jgi:predicted O-methyltransferase YrrM